jgi:nitrate reductase assembly molybdenum cofactor insertion protein NarJ
MDTKVIVPDLESAARHQAVGAFYRFLALGFGYPNEGTLDWFKTRAADELPEAVRNIQLDAPETVEEFRRKIEDIVEAADRVDMKDLEATYIAMFSFGLPDVLCPPYGSLYTSADDSRRLDEMIDTKSFYESCGVDVSEDFTDLPDHVSVEFELLNVLAGHAAEAATTDDAKRAEWATERSLAFLDRFALPLLAGMKRAASMVTPANLYCHLIDLAARFAQLNRDTLAAARDAGPQSLKGGVS